MYALKFPIKDAGKKQKRKLEKERGKDENKIDQLETKGYLIASTLRS